MRRCAVQDDKRRRATLTEITAKIDERAGEIGREWNDGFGWGFIAGTCVVACIWFLLVVGMG